MEGPLPCNIFYPHSSQSARTWLLDSLLTSQAIEENRRGHSVHRWAPGKSQIPMQNYKWVPFNEHPQNLVSGVKISQDNSTEPTQLARHCTPKWTGDRSSDSWTRWDLSHPGDRNLELANAPTSPCHAILMLLMIAPCLTLFVSAQVNKLQHAVPVQQGSIKLQPTMENITHPYADTAIRTPRLETSKRGRPNALHHPSSKGSSQRNLDAPIPKELGLPPLEVGMLGS